MSRAGAASGAEPALVAGVLAGERRALAKAITLVESTRPEQRAEADALLAALLPKSGRALRLGVSGAPGAGKSTLIDALGVHALAHGRRVGVLAVDPSSAESGGSLLGDRTRMARLGAAANAFVRPSPSSGQAGGLAPRTREALLVLEAAGYDLVIVETVGVGQGETAIADVVDVLIVLWLTGAGDEISAMKRGLLEYADIVAVNKADGANAAAARAAAEGLATLFGWLRRNAPETLALSALEDRGVAPLFDAIERRFTAASASGELEQRRRVQRARWFRAALAEAVARELELGAQGAELAGLETRVLSGELVASVAARQILEKIAGKHEKT